MKNRLNIIPLVGAATLVCGMAVPALADGIRVHVDPNTGEIVELEKAQEQASGAAHFKYRDAPSFKRKSQRVRDPKTGAVFHITSPDEGNKINAHVDDEGNLRLTEGE